MHALPEDMEKYRGRYDAGWGGHTGEALPKTIGHGADRAEVETFTERDAIAWKDAKNKEWEIRLMEAYAAMVDRLTKDLARQSST